MSSPPQPAFSVIAEDVTKTFSEGKQTVEVLRGASLHVRPAKWWRSRDRPARKDDVPVHPRVLVGPTSGTVAMCGRDLDAARPSRMQAVRRRHIGFVFQQSNCSGVTRAGERGLCANLRVSTARSRASGERAHPARRARCRAGSCRAIFRAAKHTRGHRARSRRGASVILADEPTANLDASVATQVLDLFRELARSEGRSLLIVTHDPKVRRVADRVVRIDAGRIAA